MGKLHPAMAIICAALLVALIGATLTGCPREEEMQYEEPVEAEIEAEATPEEEVDEQVEAQENGVSKTVVTIETGYGPIVAEIHDDSMPITAGSFLLLVDDGYYDGLTFHRVVPEFVIQGGDPAGDGTGGPGFSIPLENPGEVAHARGVLSMARAQHPDSAGSQFFICLSNNESVRALDDLGGGYAAFGTVTEGMEFADRVDVGDRIESITIDSESEHADAAREAARSARVPD